MPGATSPDNIWFLNASDPFAPHTATAQLASSVQAALSLRQITSFRWSTTAEKDSETDMDYGSIGYCEEDGYLYLYDIFTDDWIALNGATPGGRGSRASSVNVSSGTSYAAASLDTYSNLTGGVTSTSNGLVVPEDGWYMLSATNTWDANSSGSRAIRFLVNGGLIDVGSALPATAGTGGRYSLSGSRYLSAGDTVQVGRFQNSGGTLAENSAEISVVRFK